MNYLAHFYLADGTPDSLLGSILGDFVKGTPAGYSPEVCRGIALHRQVDAYTDTHEVVRRSKRRISPPHTRYAGIIIDVFYDHFLARNWNTYAPAPLEEFTAGVYQILEEGAGLLPAPARGLVDRMIADDWLLSYQDPEGIRAALARISRKLKRENSLGEAIEELAQNHEELQADFDRFFPDLAAYARGRGWERLPAALTSSHRGA